MEWISVSKRLPELNQWVVAMHKNKRPFTCRLQVVKDGLYNGTAYLDTDNNFRDPTHWMPLPPPPESE